MREREGSCGYADIWRGAASCSGGGSHFFFVFLLFNFLSFSFYKKRAYYISVKIRLLTGKYKRVNKDIIKRLSGFIKANNAAKIKRI